MKSLSNLIEPPGTGFAEVVPRKRRRPYRQKIRTLVHVNLDAANGAILRDLSEFGIAIQTVAPLTPDQRVRLRFELPAPKVRIEAAGRIAWTDSWGQAGVQFLNLPKGSERLLKEWILSQILSSAYLFSPCESAVVKGNRAEGASELLFSAAPRPAIRVEPGDSLRLLPEVAEIHPQRLRLLWCPFPISASALSKTVDGLILSCAVLLFAVMSILMTSALPSWPVVSALAVAVTAVFGTVYWFLFAFWIGTTPGQHLARLACLELGNEMSGDREVEARFR
jgi:PilZ domain